MPEWEIREASNGETAVRLVDDQDFDIIFVDQYMSSAEKQLLGTETVRALRSKGVTSIICGCSANDLEDAFVRAGADCFAPKPFDTPQVKLRKFMHEALEKKNNR